MNNSRIAKNTLMLYIRTLFVIFITLFTSRIVLDMLGVEDYGIYNVVGGVVMMFGAISGALTTSISRFLTFELGVGDKEKLRKVLSSSIYIQMGLSMIILILGETVGLWFLNSKMNIPVERMYAANWVFQFSLISFIITLLSVPFNALIIAHERMSAFAYVTMFEATMKLFVAICLYITSIDKLITYSLLLLLVALSVGISYLAYCFRNFSETRHLSAIDRDMIMRMTGFAGWSFVGNTAYIFNTQGVNIIINLFFGVAVNAARGVAIQVETAVLKFVNDFSTALNPQITKSYANGELEDMYNLICRGAKFSFFLLLVLSLPLILETSYVLQLWLKNPPVYADVFFQLSMIATAISVLGNSSYTGCVATGNLKLYVLVITGIGFLVFPITLVAFYMGLPVTWAYWSTIIVNSIVLLVRLKIMNYLFQFPPMMFMQSVIFPVIAVLCLAVILPVVVHSLMGTGLSRFFSVTVVSVTSSVTSIYAVGLTNKERIFICEKIKKQLKHI